MKTLEFGNALIVIDKIVAVDCVREFYKITGHDFDGFDFYLYTIGHSWQSKMYKTKKEAENERNRIIELLELTDGK